MIYKRVFCGLAALATALCCVLTAAAAEPVGQVPWLLTASGEQNARYQQCLLGDAAADALCHCLGAEVAVVNGGDLADNLAPGTVTEEDVRACFRTDRTLAVAAVTGAQLRELLEAALSHVTLTASREYDPESSAHDAFPQVAGLRISYDPGAPAGQRISRLTFQDAPVQPEDTFLLAATADMFDGEYGMPTVADYTVTEYTLVSAMAQYIRDGMADYAIQQTRIHAMEVRSGRAFQRQTILMSVALLAVLALLFIPLGKKLSKLNHKE